MMSSVLPVLILFVLGYGFIKKTPVFSDFAKGVKEGLSVCLTIFPTLLLMLISVGVFRASGAMDGLIWLLTPFCDWLSLPAQILPLALIRPLSGGGSLSVFEDLLSSAGADSLIGRIGAVLSASTETTFYTLGVYLPGDFLRGSGKFLFCALLCDFFTLLLSVGVCRFAFG